VLSAHVPSSQTV